MTTDFDREMIQTGWSVWTADGQELGTIIATDATSLRVKKRGLLGGEVQVPRESVDDVETGRVELSVTKSGSRRPRARHWCGWRRRSADGRRDWQRAETRHKRRRWRAAWARSSQFGAESGQAVPTGSPNEPGTSHLRYAS